MTYEVEKRAYLKDDSEYDRCQAFLDAHAKFIRAFSFETYLFREPTYLRIRFDKNDPMFRLTYKSGTYEDTTRKEIQVKISRIELHKLLDLLKAIGYTRAAHLHSTMRLYQFGDLKACLNQHDYLGNILEFEGLTADKSAIRLIEAKIMQAMKDIGFEVLEAKPYQRMIDTMYERGLEYIP